MEHLHLRTQVSYSPLDGTLLATASADKTVTDRQVLVNCRLRLISRLGGKLLLERLPGGSANCNDLEGRCDSHNGNCDYCHGGCNVCCDGCNTHCGGCHAVATVATAETIIATVVSSVAAAGAKVVAKWSGTTAHLG